MCNKAFYDECLDERRFGEDAEPFAIRNDPRHEHFARIRFLLEGTSRRNQSR